MMINYNPFRRCVLNYIALYLLLWIGAIKETNSSVVASIRPLGFISAAILDGIVPTQVLLPNGISEHGYSLRPSDIKLLQNADLVVWIGPEMESFMANQVSQLGIKKQVQISSLESVKFFIQERENEIHKRSNHNNHNSKECDMISCRNERNMHLWLSPEIARLAAIAIHDKLLELMPHNRIKLDTNLKDFEKQLSLTNKKVGNELAPLKGRGYYVFHDAYKYYEKYYGLTPLGYFTINPEIQPGIQHLYEIITQLNQKKAICVFSEPQFKQSVIKSITKGVSIRTGTLDPLGTNIKLNKQSYLIFLRQLAHQYANCLR